MKKSIKNTRLKIIIAKNIVLNVKYFTHVLYFSILFQLLYQQNDQMLKFGQVVFRKWGLLIVNHACKFILGNLIGGFMRTSP